MDRNWLDLSLQEQISEVDRSMEGILFGVDLAHYQLPASEVVWMVSDPYYRGLARFAQLAGVRQVLEIGTLFGGSAIALAKFAETVIAADVDLTRAKRTNLFCRNVVPYQCNSADDCLAIPLQGVDLIFVDIDHSGRVEWQLHEYFSRQYQGVVFYDDIDLNPGMRDFWYRIDCEKVTTKWHYTGFGAVKYGSVDNLR